MPSEPSNPNLLRLVEKFRTAYPWLGTPDGAKNRCIDASMWFLEDMGVLKDKMYLHMRNNCKGAGIDEFTEHHWVKVYGWNVDWTARQYDPTAPFPRFWKD